MESNRKITQIFHFSQAIVILPYLESIAEASKIMSSVWKTSRNTWLKHLKVFVDVLKPSERLRYKLEDDSFLEGLNNDDDFNWLLSLPITYFKFEMSIDHKHGRGDKKFKNFLNYLEAVEEKIQTLPENHRCLYHINNHWRLKIDANKYLKKYIEIYDILKRMGVSEEVLSVKFQKWEDDFLEPLYCPYFEKAKIIIKQEKDKVFAERYFCEYYTSHKNPHKPFYRKVSLFICEVTIQECLLFFLENWKTEIDTLVLHYSTLLEIVKQSQKSPFGKIYYCS